jgi:hypothetical protein
MKITAYAILASTSGMGVNNFLEGPDAIQYGALAILGGSLFYLLVWTLPSIIAAQASQRTDFLAAQDKDRDVFLEAQKATRHDFRDSLAGISRAH